MDDFGKYMAVAWMILLYPAFHRYAPAQREEITEHFHSRFFLPRQPLIQEQDHIVIGD